jgi:hypothetical protein
VQLNSALTSRAFLLLVAASFVVLGLIALLDPQGTVAPLGIDLQSNAAITEIRATYGGMMLGIGAFLFYTAMYRIREGLIATVAMLGAIGATRLYGIFYDDSQLPIQFYLLAVEIGFAILAMILLKVPAGVKKST